MGLTFHANCLPCRKFASNVKSNFLGKVRKNIINLSSAESAHSVVSDNSQMSKCEKSAPKLYFFLNNEFIYYMYTLSCDYLLTKLLNETDKEGI